MIKNDVHLGDCLDLMQNISSSSIDMIICDNPYQQTTQNKWDKIIPIEPLWKQYKRIIKDHGVICLTGQGLFSAKMIIAAQDIYRYSLIWKKNKPRGFLNANKQPLRIHEDILVFYKKQPIYNPQKTTGHSPVHSYIKHTTDGSNYGKTKLGVKGGGSTERYPTSIVEIDVVNNEDTDKFHSTQKPVELGKWLINTYTNVGDSVLDNACGSGSFLVAAKELGRNYIGMDISEEFVNFAKKRLEL